MKRSGLEPCYGATTDAMRCPLCGARNQCAMGLGARDASECWCRDFRFSGQLRERGGQAMEACICAACGGADRPA